MISTNGRSVVSDVDNMDGLEVGAYDSKLGPLSSVGNDVGNSITSTLGRSVVSIVDNSDGLEVGG